VAGARNGCIPNACKVQWNLLSLTMTKHGPVLLVVAFWCGRIQSKHSGLPNVVLELMLYESSIGKYALFQTAPKSKHYPAKIVSRDGRRVNLLWHTGNVYSPEDSPTSLTFSRWPRECTEALESASLIAAAKSHVGSVSISKQYN
jgi:hypothetical protein